MESIMNTGYTGLADYGRASSIMNTITGIIVAFIFFIIGLLILKSSKVDPATGQYTKQVESNRRVAMVMMVISVFIAILVFSNLYFVMHSKTYAAVQGGENIVSAI